MSAVRERAWLREAVNALGREAARSADTHLLQLEFPGYPDIDFYFKDEAAHPSGSLCLDSGQWTAPIMQPG